MTQQRTPLAHRRPLPLRRLGLLLLCALLWGMAMPVAADGSGTLSVVGRSHTLTNGETWNGDMAVIGGTAQLEQGSTLNGSLSAVGGTVHIDGTVNGDVIGMGATIDLGEHALIQGDLVVLGTLHRHPDARIVGDVLQGADASQHLKALPGIIGSGMGQLGATSTGSPLSVSDPVRRAGRWFGWMLTLLVTAALAELVLPQNIERASSALIGSWVESLAAGLLTLVASVLVIPLLVIICLGIPVAIILGIALILAILLGWVAAGKVLGSRLLLALKIEASTPMIDSLVGVVLMSLVTAIPCLGSFLSLGISAWGIGAVALTRFGSRGYPALPSSPGATSAPQDPLHDTHPLDESKAPPESEV
ncbi:MAG: hypothetical protein ACP5G7_02055 [Anaerolineae bacterium]